MIVTGANGTAKKEKKKKLANLMKSDHIIADHMADFIYAQ